ncbi:class I SAM-dependent methyltransferase [Deinococcus maricopensis]|uniref:Methyltransferase type 11 n=1 Tax=Deinococcus maricopensis (strain DSM 21211 / LMG 22137 / NRRL B-23946 / LB-34) TaxID=709986 RepID=E8U7W3_DEIML|nr:class I SAM-dependent methyltransferase [Deinococcus maricopensis]ADV67152.1 Methyltransferase type 11 [Deinococcus maricopensis DSM 21211]
MTEWDAGTYRARHAFVFEASADLVDGWLAPRAGEAVLDVGCGTGELTARIARSGAQTLGVDASAAMVDGARARFPDVPFEVQDVHVLSVPAPFDAAFSNAALHWMRPLDVAFARIRAALRPGARFALEMGGAGNVQVTLDAVAHATRTLGLPDLASPWVFPSTAELCALLEGAGFRVERTLLFERPSRLDGEDGFRVWLESFGQAWLAPLAADAHAAVLREAEAFARPRLWDGSAWVSDYVRLRALAVVPE